MSHDHRKSPHGERPMLRGPPSKGRWNKLAVYPRDIPRPTHHVLGHSAPRRGCRRQRFEHRTVRQSSEERDYKRSAPTSYRQEGSSFWDCRLHKRKVVHVDLMDMCRWLQEPPHLQCMEERWIWDRWLAGRALIPLHEIQNKTRDFSTSDPCMFSHVAGMARSIAAGRRTGYSVYMGNWPWHVSVYNSAYTCSPSTLLTPHTMRLLGDLLLNGSRFYDTCWRPCAA